MAPQSKLFCPFKAVGLVVAGKPFFLRYLNEQRHYILKVPVGNAFHIYNTSKLQLLSVSELHLSAISCMVKGSPHDFTATKDGTIYCWSAYYNLVKKLEAHKHEVQFMAVIGRNLVSVDVENNLKVWDVVEGSVYLEMDFNSNAFDITAMVHPPTYLNKVLIGSRQGSLRLINLKSSKVIYEFDGWNSAVTVIQPSHAIDVVAIGLDDGRIIIHNLKFDKTIMTLKQDWGKVTALNFRSDNNAILLSGSAVGHIGLWDLEEKCLKSTIEKAHDGPIVSLICAEGEPLAYTSSSDNVIKTWIFDMPDGGGRLHNHRDGHSEPPLRVRFHGSQGDVMISGGEDSQLRSSVVSTSRTRSLGLACYNRAMVKKSGLKASKKMPPIINFTSELTREEGWDSIAAIHLNSSTVSTWSYKKSRMNEQYLSHKRFKDSILKNGMATCIDISACGNFVFIGYNTGHIDKFNLQSQTHRLTYGEEVSHYTAVRGLVSDSLNHWLVSGSQMGILQWWTMRKGEKDKSLKLEAGVCSMTLHRESGLFAVSLDDWSLIVADIDTKSVVRELYGHHNQITDMAFSADSKWLISSSMDCTIRTWDLPTGSCIDNFVVPSPATSISLSPVDDYLVSTHVNELGIFVWVNRSFLSYVSLQPLKEDYCPPTLALPSSAPDTAPQEDSDSGDSDGEEDDENVEEYKSPSQLSEDFITVDNMPTSRWLTLNKIDQIRKRNKAVQALKVPKSAPFFLESIGGIEGKRNDAEKAEGDEPKSRISTRRDFVLETLSLFGILLKKRQHDAALEMLLKMGPSNIDLEIRNLDPDLGGSREAMLQFLNMLKDLLKNHLHFEVAQGYLSLFMKRHPDFLHTPDNEVEQVCKELADMHHKSWHVFRQDVNLSLSLLSYFKNSAVINYS
uniref:WD repeat-containing protein 36-like n=1 Tax=Hirondellea gigas TaxID=1518452 RepID=A0A6A7FQS0_9CRUS